ncbi:MAG: CPBP family intramembrane metalloprotease [Anaerolineaceae bacterium]|nr:CPBP family intramembrane metalloprotease [Anaerolineaceae bacterium]
MDPSISNKQSSWLDHLLDEVLAIRWKPTRITLLAILLYFCIVAGLLVAFQVFTTTRVAMNFITFGPITLAGLGVACPVLATTVLRKRPLSDLGITGKNLPASLILGLLLGLDTYTHTVARTEVKVNLALAPIITMVLAVGLFESVFFRGWLQMRLEEAFGILPSIVLGALLYTAYHIGYGMTWLESAPLFTFGLVFAVVYRVTRNVFVLWPLYTPVGSLYTNLLDGRVLPFEATYGFLLTVALMAAVIVVGWQVRSRQLGLRFGESRGAE